MIIPFTAEQNLFLGQGKLLAAKLAKAVHKALAPDVDVVENKRHTYIYSPPGAGKTFTVKAVAKTAGTELVEIFGHSSMNGLIIRLACAVYYKTGPIIVWIDDCDSVFMDVKGMNVMKGALSEETNKLTWNANMTNQISVFENSPVEAERMKGEALRYFQPAGSVGVEIPTDRIRFIITSNKNLVAPNSPLTTAKKMHEAAVRDRVNYVEFDNTPKQTWGWMAHVFLENELFPDKKHKLSQKQKTILLTWMWDNWKQLPATSMRAVKDYAADMLNNPKDYPDHWNMTLRSK